MKEHDEDTEEDIVEQLEADKVDSDGMWRLQSGHLVDLRHVQLHLPDGLGHEKVHAVILGTNGYVDECSQCGAELEGTDSMLLIMDEHFYLVAKCCSTMILYKKHEVIMKWM